MNGSLSNSRLQARRTAVEVPQNDVAIDCELLYESLISMWPELRAIGLGPIERELVVKRGWRLQSQTCRPMAICTRELIPLRFDENH